MNGRVLRSAWIGVAVTAMLGLAASGARAGTPLMVFGMEGPLPPMRECVDLFSKAHNVSVQIVAGPGANWINQAKREGDLIYGNSETSFSVLTLHNPRLVEAKSRTTLYLRAAGILVRKGNPKGIKSLADLTREGVKLLDLNGAGQQGIWEDMAGVEGLIAGIRKNIAATVETAEDAAERWKDLPELDAWVGFESWHDRLKDVTDLVQLPPEKRLYRATVIGIVAGSPNGALAQKFIDFLQTNEAHAVFQKWGWK